MPKGKDEARGNKANFVKEVCSNKSLHIQTIIRRRRISILMNHHKHIIKLR